MKAKLIQIGNSRGIRLSKEAIAESGLQDEVIIHIKQGQLIIKPVKSIRQDWDIKFKEMAKNQDDKLIDHETSALQISDWDKKEWEWK